MGAIYRPSQERIAAAQCELDKADRYIDLLKGALAAAGLPTPKPTPDVLLPLTRQQRALVGFLFARHPAYSDKELCLDALPGYDHVQDREPSQVAVLVTQVRKALGDKGAIINLWGEGYRLGDALHAALAAA